MLQFVAVTRLLRNLLVLPLVVGLSLGAQADSLDGFPQLRESFDPALQQSLRDTVERLGLGSAVRRRQLAISLVDISDRYEPRVAVLNGDHMMYAASLPKIGILLGAFVMVERGEMALDPATRDSLTNMIRFSSNADATHMLNRVGKQRLLNILRSERFRLYDPLINGGLWIGKEYGKKPAYARDPMHAISHGATAFQTARFYYLLETGQVVGGQLTAEMKSMLADPGIDHKFVEGLKARPGARLYRKSGSWERWHADSAIVENGAHKFIVVGLAESKHGGRWLKDVIAPLHDLIVPPQLAASDY